MTFPTRPLATARLAAAPLAPDGQPGRPALNYEKLVVWLTAVALPWGAILYLAGRLTGFLG